MIASKISFDEGAVGVTSTFLKFALSVVFAFTSNVYGLEVLTTFPSVSVQFTNS